MRGKHTRRRLVTLRSFVELSFGDGAPLPTEFRLFKAGWNDSEKGTFLFDAVAAKSVMAAYKAWGVDLMIDLEHLSLEAAPGCADPTARDARGWCKLELRGAELWAVDVRWTPDGAERLTQKRQRYVSPAFAFDPKTKRVSKVVNVAITGIPATHNTPALVAASGMEIRMAGQMARDEVEAALEALESGDDAKAMEILKSMIASAASGEDGSGGDGSEGSGAEGLAPTSETKESVEDPKVAASDAPPGNAGDEADEDKPEKKAANKALRAMVCRLANKPTFAEAVLEVQTFRQSHIALEAERATLAAERAVLEGAERRELVKTLIRLGAEFPATVWADDKQSGIKSRWLKMPLAELRSHVTEQRTARGDKAAPTPKPPAGKAPGADDSVITLSAEQLQYAKDAGCDPKEYARLIALRNSAPEAREGNAR